MLFGAAYYPEHRDPSKWEYDLDTMASAYVNCLRVGEFAWNRFEPADGEYEFAWMDRFNTLAAQRRIQLLLCPPIRTIPAWLMELEPALKIEREDGVRLEYGSRYSFCINQPLLHEKGQALAAAMATQYGRHPNIVGWHLDNEHGDEPDCHCPICRAAFQAWCRKRYSAIEELNNKWGLAFWGLTFTHFGQIPTPRAGKTWHSPGHLLAWRRFRSECTNAIVGMQAEAVRAHADPEQFITTNNQPLWNSRTDYYRMAQHVDVCGTNYYPAYGAAANPLGIGSGLGLAMCRSYKSRNFQVHELRNSAHMTPARPGNTPGPGEVERITLHCIANGAEAIFYFRWRACPFGTEQPHGAITDYDGRPKRVFSEVARIGERLARLRDLLDGTAVSSDIAMLVDFPTRWIMESGSAWNGPKTLYMEQCRTLYRAIRMQHVNCDTVHTDGVFSRYRVLVVPFLAAIDDALAEKLTTYVSAGGTLIWHPLSGIKDPEAVIYPDRLHPSLKEMLGVDITEFATAGPDESIPFTWNTTTYAGRYFCDLPVLQGAQTRAEFTQTWFAGTPALVERRVAKGRILYIMTLAEPRFYEDFFRAVCRDANICPILACEIPDDVEIVARRADDGRQMIFLLNSSGHAHVLKLDTPMYDLYNDEHLTGAIALGPFAVRIVQPE